MDRGNLNVIVCGEDTKQYHHPERQSEASAITRSTRVRDTWKRGFAFGSMVVYGLDTR